MEGSRSTHLLWGVDDAGVVSELEGAQHRSSHSQHQASRHLPENGKRVKSGISTALSAPPKRYQGTAQDAGKAAGINIQNKRENSLFWH